MKTLTKNLRFYALALIALTILFRFSLSLLLQDREFSIIWVLATLYGISVFIVAWIFGRKDKLHLPLYDIGFRFHLTTYLICNSIAKLWHSFNFQSDYENIKSVHLTIIIWGACLAVHFIIYTITRKNVIRGIKKSEIFE